MSAPEQGRVTLTCQHCGNGVRYIHDGFCLVCAPYVPPDTPGAVKVQWYCEVSDGRATR